MSGKVTFRVAGGSEHTTPNDVADAITRGLWSMEKGGVDGGFLVAVRVIVAEESAELVEEAARRYGVRLERV